MKFITKFLINLAIELTVCLVLYLIFPGFIKQSFQSYGVILWPILTLMIFGMAIPLRKRRRR